MGPAIGVRLLVVIAALSATACESAEDPEVISRSTFAQPAGVDQSKPAEPLPNEFGDYWYQGLAEISRFDLRQARYGETRNGHSVQIFVTEDFLIGPQVKLESDPAGRDVATVLKMNMTKKFITGIYPYSMMTSVFTPIDRNSHPRTLKVTTTSQEWCGQTFTQINLGEDSYRVRSFSYFEDEGDEDYSIRPDLLEDEVWTRIRLAPDDLPTGEIRVLPATMTERLMHTDGKPVTATASLQVLPVRGDSVALKRYRLQFREPKRTLEIDFESQFPHRIAAWNESYQDRGRELTTSAVRTHTRMIDYWTRNSLADTSLRESLGL